MQTSDVTVVGLGAMGVTIAGLFRAKGARVTVWNRSATRVDEEVARGAIAAPDVASAFAASPVIVMCVSNDDAVDAILGAPGVTLVGRTLIQLTTISPETARRGARWAREHDGHFLAGAIQAAPSQMGQPDTPVLVSGDRATWDAQRALLETLAGGLVYLGDDPGASATMDLATLSWVYGAMIGFVHGATIAQKEGLDVATYGRIVRDIAPSFGAFFAHEGAVIQSGDFTVSESPLRISVDATARLLETARASGLSTEFPALAASIFARAARAGLADREAAAIIEVMR
ncbi:NAD(P)-dependent oxidoreductase [Sandaracinus amylolyticus]|uniref:NAD(P)-dependent oxidoreductase n=1 Tax=Sandaracinus amylolyticus TaxID=927083 RepID=UPI001F33684B|nr:NAD(P)-binding domain-containing protein [Sandaracinus amylolyticus]UJR86033.1 Hypothetical protein I5071_81140 [Sandaracinus amylolyticus]